MLFWGANPHYSTIMIFTDSHCHVDFFPNPKIIAEHAALVGVKKIIVPAVSRARWENLFPLTKITGVYPAYGLHPLYQEEHQAADLIALENLLQQKQAIAVGECGLDFYAGEDKRQIDTFYQQLLLAKKYHLPVLVHARKSLDKVLQLIQAAGTPRFVIHSFTGSDVQLQRLLQLGGYVGIGGTSTYPRAARLRKQLAILPSDRYLLETDAPDQPICGWQGTENKPEFIPDIAANLALLRKTSVGQISKESEENAQHFFNF